jgi:hypothetical protein
MATVVVSDRRTTGIPLAAGDSLVLTVDGSISIPFGDAVIGAGGNSLSIDGDILARNSAWDRNPGWNYKLVSLRDWSAGAQRRTSKAMRPNSWPMHIDCVATGRLLREEEVA